jgi:hypothetical protein
VDSCGNYAFSSKFRIDLSQNGTFDLNDPSFIQILEEDDVHEGDDNESTNNQDQCNKQSIYFIVCLIKFGLLNYLVQTCDLSFAENSVLQIDKWNDNQIGA